MGLDVKLPDWYQDPLYQSSQDTLNTFGTDVLGGKLPEFYSSLGKTGSNEFNDMLAMVNRDTARAVQENNVRRGVSRGGIGGSSIAKAVADSSTTLRWSDFLRASGEKMNLLNMGTNTMSGVREGALNLGGQKNQFNLNRAQLEIAIAQANQASKDKKNAMWGQILSSAIGAAGTIGGFMIGRPVGAAAGSQLGGMAGKAAAGGVSDTSGVAGYNLGQLNLPAIGSYN